MIQGFWPLFQDSQKRILESLQPYPFLENNNINVPIQKGIRRYEWFAAEWTSCKNASTTYFNDSVYNSILDAEGNTCGIISIPSIEITFDNYHIRVLDDIPKR